MMNIQLIITEKFQYLHFRITCSSILITWGDMTSRLHFFERKCHFAPLYGTDAPSICQ